MLAYVGTGLCMVVGLLLICCAVGHHEDVKKERTDTQYAAHQQRHDPSQYTNEENAEYYRQQMEYYMDEGL